MSFTYPNKKELAEIAGVVTGITDHDFLYKGEKSSDSKNGLYDFFVDAYETIIEAAAWYYDEDVDETMDRNDYLDEFKKCEKLYNIFFEPNYDISEILVEVGMRLSMVLYNYSNVTSEPEFDDDYTEVSCLFGQVALELTYCTAMGKIDAGYMDRTLHFNKRINWEELIKESQE